MQANNFNMACRHYKPKDHYFKFKYMAVCVLLF